MANPTGKGGFKDHPEHINREGLNAKDKTWRGSFQRLTNMTRQELIEYFGPKTKIGRMLKELPPNVPMKDALIAIGFIQYGRDPSPSWLNMFADREEGKPNQPLSGANGEPLMPQISDEERMAKMKALAVSIAQEVKKNNES